ncbi:selenocysteine-specific elongation factor [Saccharopolyspora kobensis]|uniref:Selenocysteine-specific elongation factor n=2 Tax=Saccharopolyspora kobensis TaxID=146035 RepID=A0A1H5WY43_9PSEU|nr:selenocysteine-specific translation elongation factor [Saccharopolyspora kobensis]SEG04424.1 selenocysteine-specific elongation factor [Saccharopolyspora kobensis]SFD80921.1 selenocysteine-specific elongation factor [Saccharopolyspora kobensis]
MHVIATAGHVDHGKSTLVRRLTGTDPDRWAEERRRGLTIDLGFAWTRLADGCTAAFVDVPGHERFVPNMLAGIGPVPAVLFVVAADEGWMPQSDEHLDALDALGVRHGVLAVTRSDLADPAAATEQAAARLAGTTLAGIPAVQVSGTTGTGVDALRGELDALFHRLPPPDHDADVRLWIDRVFTVRGAGTVVTGTLTAGTLRIGDRLRLHPAGISCTVRGLQALGSPESQVGAVARVAVNLRGVDCAQARRGDALLAPDRWLTTEVFDVRIHPAPTSWPAELVLHIGSAATTVRVRPLGPVHARLTSRLPLPLRIGDRALLRDPGGHRIHGGLHVLDVRPPALTRRGAARARAAELAAMSTSPDGRAELDRRRVIRADELRAMGASPPGAGRWLISEEHRAELAARLVEVLTRHEQDDPLAGGMPVEAARRALDLPDSALVAEVAARAGIALRAGQLRHEHPQLPGHVHRAVAAVREALLDHPFRAPTAAELAALGLGDRELAAAARVGELLRVAPGLVLLPDAEQQAVERLTPLPEPFTLSQARQALDTSRRVAVPLLELLAHRGRTRRLPDGTHRVVPR